MTDITLPLSTSTASVITTSTGGIVIDYSSYFERIAKALETIATASISTSTPVVLALNSISIASTATAASVSTLASNSTAASASSSALQALATTASYIYQVLSDIATTNTDIASSLSLIAGSDYANIAASLDNISNNFGTIATISTGTGIHTAKAYDWLGSMAMYRLFVEQGKAIDTSSNITSTLKLPGNIIGTNGPNNLTLDSTIGVAVNDTVTIQHNYAGLTTGTYYVMSVDKATNIVTLSTTTSASGLITYITTSTDVSTCTNVVSAPLHAFETYVQKVGSLPTNF